MVGIRGLLIPSLACVSAPSSSGGCDFFRFLLGCSFLSGFISTNVRQNWWDRSFQDDSTAFRLLSKVKHLRGQLVLRWGTTLESWLMISFWIFRFFFFQIFCTSLPTTNSHHFNYWQAPSRTFWSSLSLSHTLSVLIGINTPSHDLSQALSSHS